MEARNALILRSLSKRLVALFLPYTAGRSLVAYKRWKDSQDKALGCVLFLIGAGSSMPAFPADPVDAALDAREAGNKAAIVSQQRIDSYADQAQRMVQEYRTMNNQIADLRIYNDQLERLVANQRTELASLEKQTAGVDVTNRKIMPLLLRMVEVLDEFVRLDIPFLKTERTTRLQDLKALMDRSDVSIADKYRRVLEAYQIEIDYGRTIEAYTGERQTDGQAQSVNFLRLGRVALFYSSIDGEQTGYWDPGARGWKRLPKKYARPINRGLRIARNELPPDLINLPIAPAHQTKGIGASQRPKAITLHVRENERQ